MVVKKEREREKKTKTLTDSRTPSALDICLATIWRIHSHKLLIPLMIPRARSFHKKNGETECMYEREREREREREGER